MMLGNVAPRECCDIVRLAAEGRLAEAQALQTRILEVDWQILSRGAAGLKAALNLLGFEAGVPRAPTPACEPPDVERIADAMRQAGLIPVAH
jgi:4-hydroxy-tetrahydrodipicolinate synthase